MVVSVFPGFVALVDPGIVVVDPGIVAPGEEPATVGVVPSPGSEGELEGGGELEGSPPDVPSPTVPVMLAESFPFALGAAVVHGWLVTVTGLSVGVTTAGAFRPLPPAAGVVVAGEAVGVVGALGPLPLEEVLVGGIVAAPDPGIVPSDPGVVELGAEPAALGGVLLGSPGLGAEPKVEPAGELAPAAPVVVGGVGPDATKPMLVGFAWAPSEPVPPEPAADPELGLPAGSPVVMSTAAWATDAIWLSDGVTAALATALQQSTAAKAPTSQSTVTRARRRWGRNVDMFLAPLITKSDTP
jgi:hypothetical protein